MSDSRVNVPGRWSSLALAPVLMVLCALLNGCTESVPPIAQDRPPDETVVEFRNGQISSHQVLDAYKVDGSMEQASFASGNETSYLIPYLEELAVDMILAVDARESELIKTATAARAERDLLDKTLLDEIIRREVDARISINEAEIEEYYNRNIDDYSRPGQYTMRNLFVEAPVEDAQVRESGREKIENALAALERGQKFWQVADIYSEVKPNIRGVELGPYRPGEIVVVQVEEAIEQLEPGQHSDIIETDDGFYIVQLVRSTPGKQQALDDVRSAIRNILYRQKRNDRLIEFYKELREKYAGEYQINLEAVQDVLAPDETVVVKAGKYTLTLGQYLDLRRLKRIETPEQDERQINAIADNYLALNHAYDVSLVDEPNVQRAHSIRWVRWLASNHLEDLVAPKINPTDQDLRVFYTLNRGRYQIPNQAHAYEVFIKTTKTDDMFRHQIETEERKAQHKAMVIIDRILKGEDFMELARLYSDHRETAARGGEIGYIKPGMNQLYDDVFFVQQQLEEGEVTRWPVQSTEGWYVFYNRDAVPGKDLTFAEATDLIRRDFIAEREKNLIQMTRQKASEQMEINLNEEALQELAAYLNEAADDIQGSRLY